MIDMLVSNLPVVLGWILTIEVVKRYMKKILILNKEVMDLQGAILTAMNDGKITKAELDVILKEAADIRVAANTVSAPIKKLWNKFFRRKS